MDASPREHKRLYASRTVRCCSQVARAVQEEGYDTVDANRQLGLPDDAREYSSVLNILKDLDVKSIKLIVRSTQLYTCCRCASGALTATAAATCGAGAAARAGLLSSHFEI